MKTALLIVDATPAFMPKGQLIVPAGDEVIAPIVQLIRRGDSDEVVNVRDDHPEDHQTFCTTHGLPPFTQKEIRGVVYTLWPKHSVAGTYEAKLHPTIAKERITMEQLKGVRGDVECLGGFNYSDGVPTGLRNRLKERDIARNVIVGLATDYCVQTTAIQSVENGFQTDVVLEACRGVAPNTTIEAIERMKVAGVNIFNTVEEFLLAQPKKTLLQPTPFF